MSYSPSSGDQILSDAFRDTDLLWALLEQTDAGLYVVDTERRILYWNPGAARISGYTAVDITGRFCHGDLLMHCDGEGAGLCGTRCPLASVITDGHPRDCMIYLRHKQGHRVPVRIRSRPIRDGHGQIIGAVEVFRPEGTAPRHAVLHGTAYGCCDEGTGLGNRAYGAMIVRQAIEALDRFELPFGWVNFALDKREELEHRHGKAFLDAAATVMARTLEHCLGPLDVLLRWGPTEFRALARCPGNRELLETARKAVVLVRSSSVAWWGDSLRVRMSAGGVLAQRTDSLESLELAATAAFEASVAAGGNQAAIKHPGTIEFSSGNVVQIT